ncbi:MAG TPA: hypothetical protein VLC55_13530 [Burkholderiales bacterium]|nr:hypothetical protein [Burkholderiales bacterium]
MPKEEEKDEELPLYEVELIPVERRLQDRRSNPASGEFHIERRQYGRRKTDLPPPPKDDRAEPPAASRPDPGKK